MAKSVKGNTEADYDLVIAEMFRDLVKKHGAANAYPFMIHPH